MGYQNHPPVSLIHRDLAVRTGIRIIIRATKPAGSRCRKGNIEIYDRGRYLTFTGHLLETALFTSSSLMCLATSGTKLLALRKGLMTTVMLITALPLPTTPR